MDLDFGKSLMKIATDKGTLSQVLQKVQAITEKKGGMPINAHALLRATEDKTLEVSATDMELSIRTRIDVDVLTPGETTVSARKLLEVVRELPREEVTLQSELNHRLLVQSGRARFQLSTIPAEDFPEMKFYEDMELFPFDAATIRKCFGKTMYGIPQENDPFSVAGVYCHPIGDELLRFIASDGHRLSYYEVPRESLAGLHMEQGIVIPRKAVQEILKVIEKEESIFLGLMEKHFILKTRDTLLSMLLLEEEYPDYRLIIPDERPHSFLVNRDDLHAAVKRVSVLTNTKWRYVRLIVSNGSLHLQAENFELGNASDELDIEYEGDDFAVAYNVRYLMEAIQVIESPQVCLEWLDSHHGGVFRDPEDPGYVGLIMPMVV